MRGTEAQCVHYLFHGIARRKFGRRSVVISDGSKLTVYGVGAGGPSLGPACNPLCWAADREEPRRLVEKEVLGGQRPWSILELMELWELNKVESGKLEKQVSNDGPDGDWIAEAIWIRQNRAEWEVMPIALAIGMGKKHPELRGALNLVTAGPPVKLREGLRALEKRGYAHYWKDYTVRLEPAAKAIAVDLVESENLAKMQELLDASRGPDWHGLREHWEALQGLQEIGHAQELWASVLTKLADRNLALERAEAIAKAASSCVPAQQAAMWLTRLLTDNISVAKSASDRSK